MSSRSLAARLKRLENRFIPPDTVPNEIVIQTVNSTGQVVGTYTLMSEGLKKRPEATTARNDDLLVVEILEPPGRL